MKAIPAFLPVYFCEEAVDHNDISSWYPMLCADQMTLYVLGSAMPDAQQDTKQMKVGLRVDLFLREVNKRDRLRLVA